MYNAIHNCRQGCLNTATWCVTSHRQGRHWHGACTMNSSDHSGRGTLPISHGINHDGTYISGVCTKKQTRARHFGDRAIIPPDVPPPTASAGHSRKASAPPSTANTDTPVLNATMHTQPINAENKPIPTPINANALRRSLEHYDSTETTYLVSGFVNGFYINVERLPNAPIPNNHKSALNHESVVNTKLKKELQYGRIAGPSRSPPFTCFQCSPLGVVPKKGLNEFRMIHDLSFPAGNSINDFILKENTHVQYETLDHVIALITQLGRGALIAKADIENAFRIIPIHPSCYHLLGFTWQQLFYYDKCLPMGCAQSCKIFERFSSSVQWILKQRGINCVSHILDDFMFVGPPESPCCQRNLDAFISLAHELSVPINHNKTCMPATTCTVHGVELDTVLWQARLPVDKVQKIAGALGNMSHRRHTTLHDLQSLIGMLNFACRVISPGRAFLRRLIALTIGVTKPGHHIKLNSEARADLSAWYTFISAFNGVAMFIDSTWVSSVSIKLYTDAASTQGFAAVFGSRWFNGTYPDIWRGYCIAVLELYPIVAALELWGKSLANHSVLFMTDNSAIVEAINRQSAKNVHLMRLIRRLVLAGLRFNVYFKAKHIPGKTNVIADKLSRFQVLAARQLAPWLHPHPVDLPSAIQPWEK